jgi:hypothetical protein
MDQRRERKFQLGRKEDFAWTQPGQLTPERAQGYFVSKKKKKDGEVREGEERRGKTDNREEVGEREKIKDIGCSEEKMASG